MALSSLAFELSDVANILELGLGLAGIFAGLTSKPTKNVASLLLSANLNEPTGRLREEPADGEEEQQGSDLKCDGEPPGEFRKTSLIEVAAVFDPVGDNNTKDVQCEFDGNELSTGLVLSSLSGPDRNDGVEHSGTPSIDKTGANHPSVVLSRGLQSSTNDGPSSSKRDCLDTTIAITEGTTNETANESTEIVDRDNATLKKRIIDDRGACFRICMTEFHSVVVIIWCGIDTTHHSLVITKEEDGQPSNTIDCNEKTTLLESMDHIGSRNQIHGSDYLVWLWLLFNISSILTMGFERM